MYRIRWMTQPRNGMGTYLVSLSWFPSREAAQRQVDHWALWFSNTYFVVQD